MSLVLGDEPLRTAWIKNESGGLFLRWIFAPSESSVVQYASTGAFRSELKGTGLQFETPGRCLLFDSVEPGKDIRGDSLTVELEAGKYSIWSATVEPSTEMHLAVYELRNKEGT